MTEVSFGMPVNLQRSLNMFNGGILPKYWKAQNFPAKTAVIQYLSFFFRSRVTTDNKTGKDERDCRGENI